MIKEFAPAKLNLTLEVRGKRPDGWHEICSLMQTIELGDELILQENQELELLLDCSSLPPWDGLRLFGLPVEDNLAYRAALLLQEVVRPQQGALIQLKKRIPSAAGLGGGSSDAGAVLRGLNQLWKLGLSRERLSELGARLGADVPFFIYNGTCLVEGLGERVTPLPPLPPHWVVLFLPPLPIREKTRILYSHLTPSHYTTGQLTHALRQALTEGTSPSVSQGWNVFTKVYPSIYPRFGNYLEAFQKAGVASPQIAGSGPTLFSLFKDKGAAQKVYAKLRDKGGWTYLSRTLEISG